MTFALIMYPKFFLYFVYSGPPSEVLPDYVEHVSNMELESDGPFDTIKGSKLARSVSKDSLLNEEERATGKIIIIIVIIIILLFHSFLKIRASFVFAILTSFTFSCSMERRYFNRIDFRL